MSTAVFYGVQLTAFGHIDGILPALAGVYVITRRDGTVVDVGETGSLKERIAQHDRRPCWARNAADQVWFHLEPALLLRLMTEKRLRDIVKPVCGIR